MTGSTVSQAFPAAISGSLGGEANAAGQAGGDLFAQLFAAVDGLPVSPAHGGALSEDLILDEVSVGQNLELAAETEQEATDAAFAVLASQQLVPAAIDTVDDVEVFPETQIYEFSAAGERSPEHPEIDEYEVPALADTEATATQRISLEVIDTSLEPEEQHVADTRDVVTEAIVNAGLSASNEVLELDLTKTDRPIAVDTDIFDAAPLSRGGADRVALANSEIVHTTDAAQTSYRDGDQQPFLNTSDSALHTLLAVISGQPTELSPPQDVGDSIDRQTFTTNSNVFSGHPIQTSLWPSDIDLQDSAVLQSLHSAEVVTNTVPKPTSTVAPTIIVGADLQTKALADSNIIEPHSPDTRLSQGPGATEASPVHLLPPVKAVNGISSILEAHAPAGVDSTTVEQAATSVLQTDGGDQRTTAPETTVSAERVSGERRPLTSVSAVTARTETLIRENTAALTANEELPQPVVRSASFDQSPPGEVSDVAELVSQIDTRNADPIELPSSAQFSGDLNTVNELAGAPNSRIPFAAPGQPLTTQLLTAVVQALATVEQTDSDSLTLRLDPPELGELEIEFRSTDNGTQVRVGAREGVTLEMLLARSGEIERLLRGQELDINKVEFVKYEGQSSSGADAGSSRDQQQQRQQWREGMPNPQQPTVRFPGAPQQTQRPATSTAQRIRA